MLRFSEDYRILEEGRSMFVRKMITIILYIFLAVIHCNTLGAASLESSKLGPIPSSIKDSFSTNSGSTSLLLTPKVEELPTATHLPIKVYETTILEKTDTCKIAVLLEAVINVPYDTIYYQWYFEGNKIPETVPSIQVDQSGAYAVDISTRLNGDTQVTQQTFVVEIEEVKIEEVVISNTSCNENNGALAVQVNSDRRIRYSLDGGSFQEENLFGNLTAGTYTVAIQDSLNCGDSQDVIVESSTPLALEAIESLPATCGAANGRILYELSGGTGQVFTLINNDTVQLSPSFDDLAQGEYTLTFIDETGCALTSKTSVSEAKCPIYIPNVFSPNDDGVNDFFQVVAETGLNPTVTKYVIFDRWGGQVYEANNFFVNSSDRWWDGTVGSKTVGLGTYLYWIEVEFENGGKQVFLGELNVLK